MATRDHKRRRGPLRVGFSTGTAAAAAAKAALTLLLTALRPARVAIDLPEGGGRLEVAVAQAEALGAGVARAVVRKDGGDDPDATHKAEIAATVTLTPGGAGAVDEPRVIILGGRGVGKVTRPGLPVGVGKAAINPVPRRMIRQAVAQAWQEAGRPAEALAVTVEISAPQGERLARRTLNPRLGIVGGISILGTHGLVKPFSHEGYTGAIDSALAVAQANGQTEVVLTTGGRSEKHAQALRPDLPALAFVQIADFFGHALGQAASLGLARVGLVSFFGKAVKQAAGHHYTHAHKAAMDLPRLARWLIEAGGGQALADEVAQANTARHALEIMRGHGRLDLAAQVGRRALASARALAGPGPALWGAVLDYDGQVLHRAEEADLCAR